MRAAPGRRRTPKPVLTVDTGPVWASDAPGVWVIAREEGRSEEAMGAAPSVQPPPSAAPDRPLAPGTAASPGLQPPLASQSGAPGGWGAAGERGNQQQQPEGGAAENLPLGGAGPPSGGARAGPQAGMVLPSAHQEARPAGRGLAEPPFFTLNLLVARAASFDEIATPPHKYYICYRTWRSSTPCASCWAAASLGCVRVCWEDDGCLLGPRTLRI